MTNIEWKNTAHIPTFFGLDARVLAPLLIWLLHMNFTTFKISIAGILFFWVILKWRKMTPMQVMDAARSKLAGKIRVRHYYRNTKSHTLSDLLSDLID